MLLPEKAKIIEVGPRDGFQNLEEFIPTDVKLEVVDRMVSAGFTKIQVTSFVHPKAIPQMKDAKEVAKAAVEKYKDVEFVALVPNFHGAKAAYEAGIGEVSCVISASEAHNKANIRRTVEESLQELEKIRSEFKTLKIKLDIATAFGCPFDGKVPVENVIEMMDRAYGMGIDGVCLCDTIGVANPAQVDEMLKAVKAAYPDKEIGLHMHDTRGMALANIVVALQNGFNLFEAAAGGLGGCPFAPGAAGNVASEDLVNMLEEMGVSTGVDLEKTVGVARLVKEKIKPELTGHMVNVCNC